MTKARIIPALVILLATTPAVAQDGDWQVFYAQGMTKFAAGDYEGAARSFEDAIGCDPAPRAGAIDYLPYTYLAASRYEVGDVQGAGMALDRARSFAVAERTEAGRRLLERYDDPILAAAAKTAAEQHAAPQAFHDYERKDVVLSDDDVDAIRASVLRRCALSNKVAADKLPWYFHYEFGLELLDAGDPQRALDALVLGANKREDSHRDSRMYGMWYIDYLPYYQIALAHAKLGNWANARSALELSSAFGEFKPMDPGYEAFQELEELVSRNTGNGS